MSKYFVALTVLLAICFMQSANAIRCYQCKSLTDARCATDGIDATSNIRAVECDSQPKPNTMEEYLPVTRCNKMTTSDKAGKIISRDCHFEVIGQRPSECRVAGGRQVDECFTCTGDLCNANIHGNSAAGRSTAMGVAGLLAVIAARFVL